MGDIVNIIFKDSEDEPLIDFGRRGEGGIRTINLDLTRALGIDPADITSAEAFVINRYAYKEIPLETTFHNGIMTFVVPAEATAVSGRHYLCITIMGANAKQRLQAYAVIRTSGQKPLSAYGIIS